MIVLVTDPYNKALSDLLAGAVDAAGLVPDVTVDLTEQPGAIDQYRLGTVPCLARIHDGHPVDFIADAWIVGKSAATIKGRFTKAVNDYEAAKQPAEV
jgi:hypothetical protein